MKSSTKKKEEIKDNKKSSVKTKSDDRVLTEQEVSILNLWEHEVRGLLNNEYANFEEAVEAVIEGVLSKMEPGQMKQDSTRDFLYEFMTSDPEVVNEIKVIFKVQ